MVRKIKRIKFIILAAVIAGAFSLGGCDPNSSTSLHEYWNAHYEGNDYVKISGLTEEGKKQKYLIVPNEIGGRTKIKLENSRGPLGDYLVVNLGPNLRGITFEGEPEIKGPFFADTKSLLWVDAKEKRQVTYPYPARYFPDKIIVIYRQNIVTDFIWEEFTVYEGPRMITEKFVSQEKSIFSNQYNEDMTPDEIYESVLKSRKDIEG